MIFPLFVIPLVGTLLPAFVWEHGLRGPSERRVRSGMASMHAALGQGLDGGVAALDIIVVDWEELVRVLGLAPAGTTMICSLVLA